MFNNSAFKRLKTASLLIGFICLHSCKDEIVLDFSETTILVEDETVVEINIPKAEGNGNAAAKINKTLKGFANNTLNIDAAKTAKTTIKENIASFRDSYKSFKKQMEEMSLAGTDLPIWEAIIDGEVLYKNETMVCIAMNSSINTGGAHGNMMMRFFNFDIATGKELKNVDLFENTKEFTALVEKYYKKELLTTYENGSLDFKGAGFQLPKTLGFSDDGIIIFYDNFNTPSNEPLEFTIPYEVANKYLKV